MNKVVFRYGFRKEYDNLAKKDNNQLYFIEDTGEIYKGEILLSKGNYYFANRENDLTDEQIISNSLKEKIPLQGDVFTIKTSIINDKYSYVVYIYYDDKWNRINDSYDAKDIYFSANTFSELNGKSLEEILVSFFETRAANADNESIDNKNGTLKLKNYGTKYFKFVPGENGQSSTYSEQIVDEDNPWIAGLQPRSGEDGELVWYQPNLETVEGLSNEIKQIKTNLDEQNEKISELGQLDTISIESVPIVVINRNVDIPIYNNGKAGLVPSFTLTGYSDRDNIYLNANGSWTEAKDSRIGDLVIDGKTYSNLNDYLSEKLKNIPSQMKWEPMINE